MNRRNRNNNNNFMGAYMRSRANYNFAPGVMANQAVKQYRGPRRLPGQRGLWAWAFFQKILNILAELKITASNVNRDAFDPNLVISIMMNMQSRNTEIIKNEEGREPFYLKKEKEIEETDNNFEKEKKEIENLKLSKKELKKKNKNLEKKYKSKIKKINKIYLQALEDNNIRILSSVEEIIFNNINQKIQDAYENDMKQLSENPNYRDLKTPKAKLFRELKMIKELLLDSIDDNDSIKHGVFKKYQKLLKEFNMKSCDSPIWNEVKKIVSELGEETIKLQMTKYHNSQPPLDNPGFYEVEPFQRKFVFNLLKGISSFIDAPTSSGKTVVASVMCTNYEKTFNDCYDELEKKDQQTTLEMIKKESGIDSKLDIVENKYKKVLVVVPTDALAMQWANNLYALYDQHIPYATEHYKTICCDRSGLMDMIEKSPACIVTPRTLATIIPMITGGDDEKEGTHIIFTHVIFDEIHMIDENECHEMELAVKLFVNCIVCFLSATISPESKDRFVNWLISIGYPKDKLDVISCNKRFFNLQNYYWDENKQTSVLINPLSLVSIEDFHGEEPEVLNKNLKPTPPDAWDLYEKLQNEYGEDELKYTDKVFDSKQKEESKKTADAIQATIVSNNNEFTNVKTSDSYDNIDNVFNEINSVEVPNEYEAETEVESKLIDCNPYRYFKIDDRISLDDSLEWFRHLIKLMVSKYKEEPNRITKILNLFKIDYRGMYIIRKNEELGNFEYRIKKIDNDSNNLINAIIQQMENNDVLNIRDLRQLMVKSIKSKLDKDKDNYKIRFFKYLSLKWIKFLPKRYSNLNSDDLISVYFEALGTDIKSSRNINEGNTYPNLAYVGACDKEKGFVFELSVIAEILKINIRLIYNTDENDDPITYIRKNENSDDYINIYYDGEYYSILLRKQIFNESKEQVEQTVDEVFNEINRNSNFIQSDNTDNLVNLLFDSKENNKLPAIVFIADGFECQKKFIEVIERIEERERLDDPDREKRIEKALKNKRKERDNEDRNNGRNNDEGNSDRKKCTDRSEARYFRNGNNQEINVDEVFNEIDDDEELSVRKPNDNFIFTSHQKFNDESFKKLVEENNLNEHLKDEDGDYHIILRCLRRGLGIYVRGLPLQYRRAVLNLYTNKKISVIFSDTSLAFGVNSPTNHVIMVKSSGSLLDGYQRIGPMLATQMSGRAGRRGKETKGNVTCLGYSWKEMMYLLAPVIPQIKGSTKLPITLSCVSKIAPHLNWDSLKTNLLNEQFNQRYELEDGTEVTYSEAYYETIEHNISPDGHWDFINNNSVNWNQLMWDLRDTGDCIKVAYLIPHIIQKFGQCEPSNEEHQKLLAHFLCSYLSIVELPESCDNQYLLPECPNTRGLHLNHQENIQIYNHIRNNIADIDEDDYPNGNIVKIVNLNKIDGRLWRAIRDNRIPIYQNQEGTGFGETIKIWNQLFYFADKILKPIQHYFWYEFGIKCHTNVTRCFGKLLTRCWYIYYGNSPLHPNFRRHLVQHNLNDIRI